MTSGHPLIFNGVNRTVFIYPGGEIAFKLARRKEGSRGARCNLFEWDLYHQVSDRQRALLCPVRACSPDGILLIMAAARHLTEEEGRELHKTKGYPDWGYRLENDEQAPFELKPADWGYFEGRLVAVDYSASVLDNE